MPVNSRLLLLLVVGLCILVAALFWLIEPAKGHDWYPISCCSDKDCRALDEAKGETVTEKGKLWVLWDGREYPKNTAGWSPDGKFHLCENPQGVILCLFAPVGGM